MTDDALNCPICLERLKNPVVTPCAGHMSCSNCMKSHIRSSSDPIMSNCPTCRAAFPIVSPDLTHVPSKYKLFINPSIRRVYIDAEGLSSSVDAEAIESLNEQVAILNARVASLHRDKSLLIERCESALRAAEKHREDERDARRAMETVRKESRDWERKYEVMKVKYRDLKEQYVIVWPPMSARSC
ncbi:hypothetical protein FA95DRAFT_1499304 [Auriscalpium vulgare]|uniref:Uncharacterized protein n=1 Tax=Auriscalpium vulgare TaxID=40419 RepID=A0ACB8RG40_9AGAM|nr:hypothetical protein FA95DRAFT_1499304 [Auriscalpium vulgare]